MCDMCSPHTVVCTSNILKKNFHIFLKIVEVDEYFPSRDVETTK